MKFRLTNKPIRELQAHELSVILNIYSGFDDPIKIIKYISGNGTVTFSLPQNMDSTSTQFVYRGKAVYALNPSRYPRYFDYNKSQSHLDIQITDYNKLIKDLEKCTYEI